jgi:hypothetical protein
MRQAYPAKPSRILNDSNMLSLSAITALEYMKTKGANKYEKNGIVSEPSHVTFTEIGTRATNIGPR